MPYVAPSTVTAGQTYTASAHNIIVEDVIDHEARINSIEYPFRNLLINGAMQVAQRATSVSGISSGATYHTADRWAQYVLTAGTWTNAVSADAPTGSGFRNSVKITCTTAVTALSAGATNIVIQRLEGQTLQMIRKGTANAQQLTLQFWVKGSTTGTYAVSIDDDDNTRSVSATYTISAANTWEQKTITFPADTTGTINNDNTLGMTLIFWLVAGSNSTSGTLQTTWGSTVAANKAVGQTNLAAAVNNYWQITGVQLEIGSYATDYAFLPYGDELTRCQRYYQKWQTNIPGYNTTTTFLGSFTYPVKTRAAPSSIVVGNGIISNIDGAYTATSGTADEIKTDGARINQTSTGMTSGRAANALAVTIEVIAEL